MRFLTCDFLKKLWLIGNPLSFIQFQLNTCLEPRDVELFSIPI